MMQPRELEPRTVYLSSTAIAELDKRAAELYVAPGTLLRMILLGKVDPLEI